MASGVPGHALPLAGVIVSVTDPEIISVALGVYIGFKSEELLKVPDPEVVHKTEV
jgi:hypothetical protein